MNRVNNRANYLIEVDAPEYMILRDMGPWTEYKTITNAVELVVEELHALGRLTDQGLYYYDSSGDLDQIVHHNGEFKRFAAGGPDGYQPTR